MTEKLNLKYLRILSIVLLLPIITETIAIVTEGSGSRYTAGVYVALLLYSIYTIKLRIDSKDIKLLVSFYVFYGLNYIFFEDTRNYYDITIIMCLLFFMPIAIIIVKNIRNWKPFFEIFYPFSLCGIALASFIVLTFSDLEYSDFFSYMEFSYGLLPCLICVYENLRNDFIYKSKASFRRYLSLSVLLLGIIATIVYGARATFFFFLMYIAFSWVVKKQLSASRIIAYSFLGVVVIILIPYIEVALEELSTFGIFQSSRLLTKFAGGELMESTTRDEIYRLCLNRIGDVGFGYYGVFGDRPYCGSVYPHNIIYELLMSFGWLVGGCALFCLARLVFKSLFKSSYGDIALFFVCAFLMRYFVSGSYVIEGRFWIMLFGLVSLLNANKRIINLQILK